MQRSAGNAKLAEYEQFLETRLRTDLNDATTLRQALTNEQEDYRALGQNIHLLVKVCNSLLPQSLHVSCVQDLSLHAG